MPDPPEDYRYFVGIDVSKQTLDVCLMVPSKSVTPQLEVTNDKEGFSEFIQWLTSHKAQPEETVVCLENTGLYDDQLLETLTLAGYPCAVEKTTVLEAVSPEHHRKEDDFDAELLAEYAYRFTDKLRLWSAPKPVIEEIRLLYRERRRLLIQRAAVLQLQGEAPRRTADTRFAEELWQQQIDFFDEQIKQLEEKLEELVRSDDDIFRRYELIKSMPGFGPVASLLWIMLFYGKQRLCARKVASRFGFAPHPWRSGTSQRGRARSSGHGKPEVRKVLTLCARSAGTHHRKFNQYKEKKLAEGKPSQLVTNNLINKLIRIACTLWNQETFYDPNHVSRFAKKTAVTT